MYQPIKVTKRASPAPARNLASHSMPRRSFSEGGSLITVLLLALACFGLAPAPKAFGVSPAPDGGYPGANTAEGQNALQSLSSGLHNTALGYQTLFSDTTGNFNTATGSLALFSNTTGSNNTANGLQALFSNTTGSFNTANGRQALFHNTTGFQNTANGSGALYSNTTGSGNTANGVQALYSNTTSYYNTAVGEYALYSNTTGSGNTANGVQALFYNSTGGANTANGYQALYQNTTSFRNTANGFEALYFNTTGADNIALGYLAGSALTTGDDNIDIGNDGSAGESNKIRIGIEGTQTATFIAGISGATVTGTAVVVSSSGQLGVAPSSERFKTEIKPMDKASEVILALKPVTFRYKHELDPDGIPQFGLVAELSGKGESRSGGARCRRESLYRALRGGERDVAQRVPQRAPQGREARSDDRAIKEGRPSNRRAT
jgi:hypothetical protein